MIILGIDPGFAITGYGVIKYEKNKLQLLEYGVVSTKKEMPFTQRLMAIDEKIRELCDIYKPDCCAIEELFFNNNAKTAIAAAQGRGIAVGAVASLKIPVYEYTPLQVKQAVVGYGRAEKKQIQQMVKMILHMEDIPRPDDAADAIAIAICHSQWLLTAKPI
ncbi:MAG: crossover junction endodeoxyribonuclease RuvC [Ruminococcaceae bacterium]|nr:crossover junction endodeoxyribonuclease RuvC [Oscillospiraceae bacterium]